MVWVRRDFCDRVTEREELVGRFRAVSRLPQYLQYNQFSCIDWVGTQKGVEEHHGWWLYLGHWEMIGVPT